jgi:hypothetical protein
MVKPLLHDDKSHEEWESWIKNRLYKKIMLLTIIGIAIIIIV